MKRHTRVTSTLVSAAAAMAVALAPVIDVAGTADAVAQTQPRAQSAHSLPQYRSYVTALYADYLGRGAGPSEIAHWANKLAQGAPVTSVSDGFVTSDEYRMIRITEAYQHVLGRGVDPSGAVTWLNAMRSGQITTDDIERALFRSEEFYNLAGARYSMPPNDGSFVDALYHYILNREPAGLEGADLLNAGFMQNRDFFINRIYYSQEAANDRTTGMYQRYFGRNPDSSGLATWATVDLRIGDTATRSGLTSSDEYFQLATRRFPR